MKNVCLNSYTSPWCQFAVATKFSAVAPNNCGPSHLSLLHVSLPEPSILRLFLDIWKVCAPLEFVVLTSVSFKMMVVCDVTSCGMAGIGVSTWTCCVHLQSRRARRTWKVVRDRRSWVWDWDPNKTVDSGKNFYPEDRDSRFLRNHTASNPIYCCENLTFR